MTVHRATTTTSTLRNRFCLLSAELIQNKKKKIAVTTTSVYYDTRARTRACERDREENERSRKTVYVISLSVRSLAVAAVFCLAKHWTRKFLSRRQTQRHRQRACIIFSSHSAHPKTHFRANYGTYTSTRRSVQSHLWHDQSVTFAVYFVVVVVARARTQMSQSIAQSARARAHTRPTNQIRVIKSILKLLIHIQSQYVHRWICFRFVAIYW